MAVVALHTPAQKLVTVAWIATGKTTKKARKRCRKRTLRTARKVTEADDIVARVEAVQWMRAVCRTCGGCERALR